MTNSDLDIKNDQRIKCLFDYVSSNSSTSFTLFGFSLTSLVFLFSISHLYNFDYIIFSVIFIFLSIGLIFLLLSSIIFYFSKDKFVKFLILEEEEKKARPDIFCKAILELVDMTNRFLITGIISLFIGILYILSSLFIEGFVTMLIIFVLLMIFIIIFIRNKYFKALNNLEKEYEK